MAKRIELNLNICNIEFDFNWFETLGEDENEMTIPYEISFISTQGRN